jgi:glycosyltransferase involved in cell wall biosynthesis
MAIRFSLVIPAYNEAAYLPRLLDTVDAARRAYDGGSDAVEVIVADNASTDETAAIARERGCRVAAVEKRVIGAARNGGARIAQGEIVSFVDADMRIHPDTFNAIDRALATGRFIGGATGALPERWSLGIATTLALVMPLVILARMDTGVVFCRREDFEAIGGYREDRLFAEDVAFLMALKRLGWRRHQVLARVISARAIASTRKFDKHGEWHFLRLPWVMVVAAFRDPEHQGWAKKYWYEDR